MEREKDHDRMLGFASLVLRITLIGLLVFAVNLIFWLGVEPSRIYHNLALGLFLEAGFLMVMGWSVQAYRGDLRRSVRFQPPPSGRKNLAASIIGLGLFVLLMAVLVSLVLKV